MHGGISIVEESRKYHIQLCWVGASSLVGRDTPCLSKCNLI